MTLTTKERWAGLVTAYETADRQWTAATKAVEALPPGSGADTPEERACDIARDKAYECEDALLAARVPTLADAAYQLKIIASRHHDVDFDDTDASGSSTVESEALRRIYELMTVAGRRLSLRTTRRG